MIYFIRSAETDSVKIGFSHNPWARLSKIQSDSPGTLTIEALIEGDAAAERTFHKRFAAQRLRGEWFTWSGPVQAFAATQTPVDRPRRRCSTKTQILKAIVSLGFGKSYASRLLGGHRPWTLALAVAVWRECGHKVGPIAKATDEHMAVLSEYAVLEP